MHYISFWANIFLDATEEGGRKRPIVSGYRPNIRFGSGQLTDAVIHFKKRPSIAPGESATVRITFFADKLTDLPKTNALFYIQEGGKRIGHGTITRKIKEAETEALLFTHPV